MKGILGITLALILVIFMAGGAIAEGTKVTDESGDGEIVVSPTTATVGVSNNYIFTFDIENHNWDKGSYVTIQVPSGWTMPQDTSSGSPGYVATAAMTCKDAYVSSIQGSLITISISCQGDKSFDMVYANSTPTQAGTFQFTTQTSFQGAPPANISIQPNITVFNSPHISSISPSSAYVGDYVFNMTVTGANFTSNSVVNYDGTGQNTMYISPTALSITVPDAAMLFSGNHSITVTNPLGGSTSNSRTFTINPNIYTNKLIPATISVGTAVTDDATSTSNGGHKMAFAWSSPNATTTCLDTIVTGPYNYSDSCFVDAAGLWNISVIEYNSNNQEIGTDSESPQAFQAPEFGKFGAMIPLVAVCLLYMSLRKKILKK